jgi:hypothetical protein
MRRFSVLAALVALLALGMSVASTGPAAAIGTFDISPTHGPVGTTINAHGYCSVYFPNTRVTLTFTGPNGTTASANGPVGFGGWYISVQVPTGTLPGTAQLEAGCPGETIGPVPFSVDSPATATITTPSGLLLPGAALTGTAADPIGIGVGNVLVYYNSLIGGPSGVLLADCPGCGAGQNAVTWSVAHAALPYGIYQFVAQPIDAQTNFGGASNVVYLIVL